jgi:hypothetical protein
VMLSFDDLPCVSSHKLSSRGFTLSCFWLIAGSHWFGGNLPSMVELFPSGGWQVLAGLGYILVNPVVIVTLCESQSV